VHNSVFQENVHSDLEGSKILKTNDTRPATVSLNTDVALGMKLAVNSFHL